MSADLINELQTYLERAIAFFAEEHPRIYKANEDAFTVVFKNAKHIARYANELFKVNKRKQRIVIAFRNKLSYWKLLVIRLYRNECDIINTYWYRVDYDADADFFITENGLGKTVLHFYPHPKLKNFDLITEIYNKVSK